MADPQAPHSGDPQDVVPPGYDTPPPIGDEPAEAAPRLPRARRTGRQARAQGPNRDNEAVWLADEFIRRNYTDSDGSRLIYLYNKFIHKYTGTHWRQAARDTLQDQITLFVGEHAISKRECKLLDAINRFVFAKLRLVDERRWNTWLNEPPTAGELNHFVALANGILDLKRPEDGLKAHTPNWFSRVCLPFNYQPETGCPLWIKFINECFSSDPERVALLQEWFGYVLTPDVSLGKFMLFEGPTRAGKGVTANVLTHLLGEEDVSQVALERLDNQFTPTTMAGKLLNICDETDQIERVAEASLKRLTGATAKINFEIKHVQDPLVEAATARILIISNNGIPIYDRSQAVLARMLHLAFDRSYLGREDTELAEKLYGELPGIFNWAVEGYARIHAAKRFTEPARSAEALRHYEEQCNPFKVWFDEFVEVTHNKADFLFKRFNVLNCHNAWLKEGGHKPISDPVCARQVRLLVPGIQEARIDRMKEDGSSSKEWAWLGVRFRDLSQ